MHGRAEVNLLSTNTVVTEALLLELMEDGKPGVPTHAYNGTLKLDQEARTLFIRSVVVTMTNNHDCCRRLGDFKCLGCCNLIKF